MDFLLPKLSATMETATITQWLRQPGDKVRMGEALVEVETDKATMEIEAPADVILTEILAAAGSEQPLGAVLARLDPLGATATAPVTPAVAIVPAAITPATITPATITPPAPAAAKPTRTLASPLARRLARQHGVDLGKLTGSGPHQRIRKRDVLGAIPTTSAPGFKPLSALRSGIAASVSLSRQTIPAFTLDRWVDTTALSQARSLLAPGILQQTGVSLTFTDLMLQALADSLTNSPNMRARYAEQNGVAGQIDSDTVDIGLVVAVSGGVMIPILRNLGGTSLGQIASARQAAMQRARNGRLNQSDTGPASLSVSNTGRHGPDRFEAIISPGQTGILAIGREHDRVIPRAGGIALSRGVTLALSVDHRLIDGLIGAQFLAHLVQRVEQGPWSAD